MCRTHGTSFHLLTKKYKLDMSTARRCLKSPQSLYSTSTHPTRVTHRSADDKHDQRDIATKFWSDCLSGSHFILQTRKFLLIYVTAVTLGQGQGQGHQTVIQYILPNLYFLCPEYLRFSSNAFDVRSKSHCGSGGGGGSGNELKT